MDDQQDGLTPPTRTAGRPLVLINGAIQYPKTEHRFRCGYAPSPERQWVGLAPRARPQGSPP